MLNRHAIRFLVPYSRTLYFVDKGRERGISAELARNFEGYVNKKYAAQLNRRPLTVFLIPTTRDRLLTGLVAGSGDISAGNLTATDERLKIVDFIAPRDRKPVRELVVTGPMSPSLSTIDDLSGKQVYVRKSSSYHESLSALNERFRKSGKPPVNITLLPDALEDEDATTGSVLVGVIAFANVTKSTGACLVWLVMLAFLHLPRRDQDGSGNAASRFCSCDCWANEPWDPVTG